MSDPVSCFKTFTMQQDPNSFGDRQLEQLKEDVGMTTEKVTYEIARILLLNLPSYSADHYRTTSLKLKEMIHQLSRAYDAINFAKHYKKSPFTNPEVMNLANRAKRFEMEPLEFYNKLINDAPIFNEQLRTFPNRHGLNLNTYYHKETALFEWICGDVKFGRVQDLYAFGPYFFKQIAIYSNEKWLTWFEFAKEWAQTGDKIEILTHFVKALPWYWMIDTQIEVQNKTHDLSLREYTFKKTLESLESSLGIETSSKAIQELFFEKMCDPQFRMDIVFFTGNAKEMLEAVFDFSKNAPHWILALRFYSSILKDMPDDEQKNGFLRVIETSTRAVNSDTTLKVGDWVKIIDQNLNDF